MQPKDSRFQSAAKLAVKTLLNWREGYRFYPTPSIQKQTINFAFRGRSLVIEADYTTPLYEAIAEVIDYDCYQLAGIDFSSSKRSVIVDIGANIGVSALALAQLGASQVACFEPISENYELLRRNLELNAISNVTAILAAVTRQDGTDTFQKNPNESVSALNVGLLKTYTPVNLLKVKTVSLRTALEPYLDSSIALIKIDCEGGEYDIVDQLTPDLIERIQHISFEVHDLDKTRNLKTLTKQLESLGFRTLYKPDIFNRRRLHHLLATH